MTMNNAQFQLQKMLKPSKSPDEPQILYQRTAFVHFLVFYLVLFF